MKKVLIVDDNECTRNLYTMCLNMEGFETIVAENSTIGIQRAQWRSPDLVICNVCRRDCDGHDLLHNLRNIPATATIPFVFITSGIVGSKFLQNLDAAKDCCLIAPLTVAQLLEAISTQVASQAMCQDVQEHDMYLEKEVISTLAASRNSKSFFPPSTQLQRVFDFIEANYHLPITLSDVAQAAGYSPAYLTTLVGRQTGRTVARWIIERRMAEACHLLASSDETIERIASSVGYANPRHFFRQFLQYHGIPPQIWRKEYRLSIAN
jgi:AraC-like DNA-binding protein/CheY-like chemotaxis protein